MTGLETKVDPLYSCPTLHADHERTGSTRCAPHLDKDGHLCIQQASGSGNATTGVVYNVKDNSRPLSRQASASIRTSERPHLRDHGRQIRVRSHPPALSPQVL